MTQQEPCKLHGAYWIKPASDAYALKGLNPDVRENRLFYYRLAVRLDEPDSLQLSISANTRYRLWINGEPISSGPLKGDRWRHYYDTMDVSSNLRTGINVIAVQVWSLNTYLVNDPTRSDQPLYSMTSLPIGPRLAVSGTCLNAHGEPLADIATGLADWRVMVDDAVTFHSDEAYTIFMGAIAERVNADNIPERWKHSDAQGLWLEAEKGDPCLGRDDSYPYQIVPQLPLIQRPIPLLYEVKRDFRREMLIRKDDLQAFSFSDAGCEDAWVEIPPYSRVVVELDAGELTTGYLSYPMEKGKGSHIVFRYAERYFERGNEKANSVRDDAENGVIMGMEDNYYPSGRSELYEPFWLRTFRFVRIEVQTEDQTLRIRALGTGRAPIRLGQRLPSLRRLLGWSSYGTSVSGLCSFACTRRMRTVPIMSRCSLSWIPDSKLCLPIVSEEIRAWFEKRWKTFTTRCFPKGLHRTGSRARWFRLSLRSLCIIFICFTIIIGIRVMSI